MRLVGEVDVRKSTAYFAKDRKRIFAAIESHKSIKMDDLNMIVMGELRRWLIFEGLKCLTKHWPSSSSLPLPSSIFKEMNENKTEEIDSSADHSTKKKLSNTQLIRLSNQVSRLLLEFTKYDVALDLLECAVKFGEISEDVEEYGEEMQNVSNFLCWLLIDRSRYQRAMRLLKKHFERNKLKLGWNHDVTLQCTAHLLRCFHETGKLEAALSVGEEALSNSTLSDSNVRILELKFCVGKLLIDMSRLPEAKTYLEEAMLGCKKLGVKRHWITMSSEAFLGKILMEQNDFDKAENAIRNALRDARIARGEDHKITLYAKSFLCRLLVVSSGKSSEINSILPRCLADCVRLLGRTHWLTIYCRDTQEMRIKTTSSSSSRKEESTTLMSS